MNTITAILEADADGTLHLPVPAEFQSGKIQIIATLQPVTTDGNPPLETSRKAPKAGSLTGFWVAHDFDEPPEDFKEYME